MTAKYRTYRMKAKGKVEKKRYNPIIGLIYHQQTFYAARIDAEQVHFYQADSLEMLQQQLCSIFPNLTKNNKKYDLITAIPPHLSWYTSKTFPYLLSSYECYIQAQRLLQQQLPNEQENIWFDYRFNHSRLELYAVKEIYAQKVINQFLPLKINILDIFNHTILRSFRWLTSTKHENLLYCFYDQQQSYFLIDTPQQLIPATNLETIKQLLQSQNLALHHCVLYQAPPNLDLNFLPSQCSVQHLDSELNTGQFLALGCALWK